MRNNHMHHIIEEINKYVPILEHHFRDMVDIDFTIENGKFYLLMARKGNRTANANLKIAMSMFCEGIMSAEDVITNLNSGHIEELINTATLTNARDLDVLARGLPASSGIGVGVICFSYDEAMERIDNEINYIYCKWEVSPEDIYIMASHYCQGVITARGGMTSHAAVICRGMGIPCISGFGDYESLKDDLQAYGNYATADGNGGCIYGGKGSVEYNQIKKPEINLLYQLLKTVIQYNAVSPVIFPLVWRLWDIVVLGYRHIRGTVAKRVVYKTYSQYISFSQPSQNAINMIYSSLYSIDNTSILVEDFISYMIAQLSSQVSLGNHYLYMRPLLNPMESIRIYDNQKGVAGCQLVGIEFFNVNRFVDHMLDISSIKIYFCSKFYESDFDGETSNTYEELSNKYWPLNYLDFTNPNGESLIMNTYDTDLLSVYINDVLIPPENLAMVYHLMRRRFYHWTWYKDNNITKEGIIDYLLSRKYLKETDTKIYYLCEEMHLVDGKKLTSIGRSLLGEKEC